MLMLIVLMVLSATSHAQTRPNRVLSTHEMSIVSDTLKDGWTFWEVDANEPSIHNTRYVWANRESVRLLGIDRRTSVGKAFAEVVVGSDTEAGRRWVTMYADAIHTGLPVHINEVDYNGTKYEVTILPVAEDLIVVLFQAIGTSPNKNLTLSDDEWLRIQIEALSALQTKTEGKIKDIEQAAEEVEDTDLGPVYGPFQQSPAE